MCSGWPCVATLEHYMSLENDRNIDICASLAIGHPLSSQDIYMLYRNRAKFVGLCFGCLF
jgi:hypothetical protein